MFGWNFPFILPVLAIPVAFIVLFKLNNPEPEVSENLLEYRMRLKVLIINRFTYFYRRDYHFSFTIWCLFKLFPFIIEGTFGATSLVTGLVMFSMSITNALTASQLKRLSERFSVKTLLKVAFLFLALALFLVPFVNKLWMLLIPALIFGIGQGYE